MVHRGRVAFTSILFTIFSSGVFFTSGVGAEPAKSADSTKSAESTKSAGTAESAESAEPADPTGAKADEDSPASAKASLSVGSSGEKSTSAANPPTEAAERDSSQETGLILRATLGGGFAWAQAPRTDSQEDLAVQSVGGMLLVQPGYEFLPGLAVHADLYASMNFAHKLRSDTEAIVYEKKKVGFIAPTVGVGVSYHALPADLFVSAGAGLSLLWGSEWFDAVGGTALTEPDVTGIGYAARGSVGKLFSVHRRWSVGGALNYDFQTFGRRDDAVLSIKRAHTLWLGFSTSFHPARP